MPSHLPLLYHPYHLPHPLHSHLCPIIFGHQKCRQYLSQILDRLCHPQKSAVLLISRLLFSSLVREIAGDFKNNIKTQSIALSVLKETSERWLLFAEFWLNSHLAAFHGRRIIVILKDARFMGKIINIWDTGRLLSQFASERGLLYEQHQKRYFVYDIFPSLPSLPSFGLPG